MRLLKWPWAGTPLGTETEEAGGDGKRRKGELAQLQPAPEEDTWESPKDGTEGFRVPPEASSRGRGGKASPLEAGKGWRKGKGVEEIA